MWKQSQFIYDTFCLSWLSDGFKWHKRTRKYNVLTPYFFFCYRFVYMMWWQERRKKNLSLRSTTWSFEWCLLIWMNNTTEALLSLQKKLSPIGVIWKSAVHIITLLLSSILIILTKEEMQFTSMNIVIIFWIVLLLVIVRPSHQYIYSCSSNALCGCSSNPASVTRIVGGESAGTSTWGWAVSISINGNSLCGGSIISSTWIITAAHCLSGVSASTVIVYAGSNSRFTGQSRTAYRTFVHPSYVSDTKVNDIALIQLSTPLTMSSSVSSICIPSVSTSTLAAGEWPPAGSYVCCIMAFFFKFEINNQLLLNRL